MSDFAERVLTWYDQHGRKDLPWQQQPSAYRVWVSEIMLQQTQVLTVIPYYERFMQSFPDVASLASAPLDSVLQHWSGLGYYARARNLHRAGLIIRDDYAGEFPSSFDEVVALPGIGRSTAGAILSLSFGQRQVILDGNVKRVLARHAAVDGRPGNTAVANTLWQIADKQTPDQRVAAYSQAMMDLGAMICTRTKAQCNACPVSDDCRALAQGAVAAYPGRKAKKAKPLKRTAMVLALHDDAVYLERRPEAGIWGGLWSFPELSDVEVTEWCERVLQSDAASIENWDTLRHSFSHYDLDIQPIVVRVATLSRTVADSGDTTWYSLADAPPGGMAAPVTKLINTLKTGRYVQNS